MGIGFVTGLLYLVAILYAINDYDALFDSAYPIAEIYRQATGSSAGAIGLLCLLLFCITLNVVGVYITAGRTLWTLARDRATPFPTWVGKISPRLGMPMNATIVCGVFATVLGWYVSTCCFSVCCYSVVRDQTDKRRAVSTSEAQRPSTLSWAAMFL
jgi:amino acid transporter